MTGDEVIERHAAEFAVPGVLSVRPGFLFRDGWITDEPALVVTVSAAVAGLPASVEGLAVDIRVASERKLLRIQDPAAYRATTGASPDLGAVPEFEAERRLAGGVASRLADAVVPEVSKPQLPYAPPSGVSLDPVDVTTSITLSASPDSGWPTLSAFLGATKTSLTVGLYDFTSAHVLSTVEKVLDGKKVTLVLDHPAKNPTADQTDEQTVQSLAKAFGDDLEQAWALDRMDPLAAAWVFPTAYHMKVAVRDSAVVWLSSGNWNNSNQPDIDPVTVPGDAAEARTRDRDWHVVIDDAGLAKTFEAFLANDYSVASTHDVQGAGNAKASDAGQVAPELLLPEATTPPFDEFFPSTVVTDTTRITPVLTPDPGVYVGAVEALITGAAKSLHLQFQYIELPKTATDASKPFADLVAAVIARQKAGVDVKIIMSQYETAGYLEQLQTAGLDVVSSVRLQSNVHNKGIVVDGERVLVSSQNWSTAGTLTNRDAGVILDSAAAAAYFDRNFAHDWEHLAAPRAAFD